MLDEEMKNQKIVNESDTSEFMKNTDLYEKIKKTTKAE